MLDFSLSNTYTDDAVISNDLMYVSQQIDLLFDTETGSILGDEYFGSNYDKYLYTLDFGNGDLEEKIKSDIMRLDLCGINPQIIVRLLEGTERDIAIIEIIIDEHYPNLNKTFVIK